MASVFISHSSKDKKFVRTLISALNERNVLTWVDDKQIKVGQPIPARIAEGIRRCDFFLIVISQTAIESRWVENELNSAYFEAATKKNDAILPVLLEKIQPPGLLRALQYADFTESFEEGLSELLGSLEINDDEIHFMSRTERRIRIKAMLPTVNKYGELPEEVITMVEDESYLDIFEANIDINTDRRILRNSIYAIRYLADAWDGRCIRRHQSIAPLLHLYEEAYSMSDVHLMLDAVSALCAIDSDSTRDFLINVIKRGNQEITSEILSDWQNMHEWPSGNVWIPKILPLLHEITSFSDEQSLYFKSEFGEQDLRYWAFRCLQGLKRKSSRRHIEAALNSLKYPIDTLVEAAYAHWCVTGSEEYLHILRRASRSGTSNAKHFLSKVNEASPRSSRTVEKRRD